MTLPTERRKILTAKAMEYAEAVDDVLTYLLSRGISKEAAQLFMLGCATDGDYRGRLTIPYVTPGGVVHIKYRCANPAHHEGLKHVHDSCPKYLYEAGNKHHLFNAQVLIHAADTVVLTEGELDAVCVQAYTGLPAVGYPGVDSWHDKPHFALCFEGVGEVIVVADGDDPGRKSAERVAKSLGFSARVVELPTGFDSNSYIATQGAPAYIERISA